MQGKYRFSSDRQCYTFRVEKVNTKEQILCLGRRVSHTRVNFTPRDAIQSTCDFQLKYTRELIRGRVGTIKLF